jgi:hypothetical protein
MLSPIKFYLKFYFLLCWISICFSYWGMCFEKEFDMKYFSNFMRTSQYIIVLTNLFMFLLFSPCHNYNLTSSKHCFIFVCTLLSSLSWKINVLCQVQPDAGICAYFLGFSWVLPNPLILKCSFIMSTVIRSLVMVTS